MTIHFQNFLAGFLAIFCCLGVGSAQAAATWTPRYLGATVNGQVTPFGYYEYLPSGYNANSQATYPVVIFLHGSGQNGNGLATGSPNLSAVLGAGVPQMIANSTAPLAPSGGLFDLNNVIVLCPQQVNPYPWIPQSQVRPFLNYALAAYPKIDRRRIWLTGLSYGSSGVSGMMDNTQDPSPDDAAAVVACAWRGDDFTTPAIAAIGKVVPFWLLTGIDDVSSNPDQAVNNLAVAIHGSAVPNGDTTVFPASFHTSTYTGTNTAYFTGSAWALATQGFDPISGVNPKMTYLPYNLPGGDHDSWDSTYGSSNVWTWLFQQQKPTVSVTSPASDIVVSSGTTVSLTGAASDMNGTVLTGASLQWSSSLGGILGAGSSLSVGNLGYGYHLIRFQAIDNGYRDNKALVHVTVPYPNAFTALFDFGATGINTPGWNDVTNNAATVFPSPSVITDAVSSSGTPIGINLALVSGFFNTVSQGVASSALYPLAAQENGFQNTQTDYAGNPLPNPQLLISGLNPAQTYNFTFFASTTYELGPTNYTINGTTASLVTYNNSNNTVSINNVTPTAAGQVTITLSRGTGAYAVWLNVLTISSAGSVSVAPAITSGTPPPPSLNNAYSFFESASGYPTPTWSVTSGSLPPGLTLSSQGWISGTPTTAGAYTGTISAGNGVGSAASQNFSITVQVPVAPAITNVPPATTQLGAAYSFAFAATGSPAPTYSLSSGALPPGLFLSPSGVLSGSTITAGLFSGTVTASNGISPTATQSFSIAVQQAPGISIPSAPVNIAPGGTAILGYNAGTDLTTLGTPFLHLDNNQFTTTINDGIGATYADTFGNSGPYGYGGITFAAPITATVTNLNVTMHLFVDGGWFGPNNISAAGIAAGATGGTLVAAALTDPQLQATSDGTTWFNVAATDDYLSKLTGLAAASAAAPAITYTLNSPLSNIRGIRLIGPNGGTAGTSAHGFIGFNQIQVNTLPIPIGTTGISYAYAFPYTGYPAPAFSLTGGALPPGITLVSTGVLSGIPTLAGTYAATVTAANGIGSPATQALSITVLQGTMAPAITGTPPGGTLGASYHFAYSLTGSPAPTATVATGSLPPGLALSTSGVLSGVPTSLGTYAGTLSASNGIGSAAVQNFSITVISPFAQWASGFFNGAGSSVSGPAATPQNDGTPNLLKYLANINPASAMSAADRAALPVSGLATGGNASYLTLTYRRSATATGITVNVQTSTDLKTWQTVVPDLTQNLGNDPNTGDPIVEVEVKTGGASRQFIRLNVTLP